ncbi:MAG TPA: TIGR03118 family protein [Casimicrobiaceae bacterium]|nr:TIGR03118 family protein [Casimicrobiaceae bacterium]
MNAEQVASSRSVGSWAMAAATLIALSLTSVARADSEGRYQQHNLVSDGFVTADHTDPNLVNPWGIAFNPFGPVWIADNGSGLSTLYNGTGTPQALVVIIPPAAAAAGGNPTGIVFNGSNGFVVSTSSNSGPAKFIFATEDGVIAGWNPAVDGTHAILVKDNSTTTGAVYKGLALSAGGNGSLLYATDFHNNKIDVWDSTFATVTLPPGAFADPTIPSGFAPFGIQAIGGNIYVTYAKQDAARHDDVKGMGLGYVDVFDPNGRLIERVASRGKLNAPWGIALAPAGFGEFRNTLLIGNFGDGHINAFDNATGESYGQLKGVDGKPIAIDGLWGMAFGNGFAGQSVNTLFFTAGSNDEADGLYGSLDAVSGHGKGHD